MQPTRSPTPPTPRMQETVILEQQGKLRAAAAAFAATRKESTNWRTWLTLSRIQAERDRVGESVRAYKRAHTFNPRRGLLRT